ncbi:MAG: M48 family metalloprotease [Myxococcota bacterium]|nr:M48 family metalloprotease [Myxococcota bacterium]
MLVSAGVLPLHASGDEEQRLSDLALGRLLEGQERVTRVADPIRIAGMPYCGRKTAPILGVYAADDRTYRDMFPEEPEFERPFREAAARRFALGLAPKLLLVTTGLPADRAGLRPGDVITHIDGRAIEKRVRLDVMRGFGEDGVLRLGFDRAGETGSVEVEVELGCTFPARFWFGTSVNAFATYWGDLTGVYVISGMLRFLPDDDDLAIVLGHELAHMILSHRGVATTERTEADADYLGMYLAARAGFDVSGANALWDRMARHNPFSTIDWGFYGHPTSPARSLALEATRQEIAEKLQRGEPLEPEWSQ